MLFSDIEGSTRLLESLGEVFTDVLDEYRRIVRRAIAVVSHERGGVCEACSVWVALLGTCGEVAVATSDQLPYGELIATHLEAGTSDEWERLS